MNRSPALLEQLKSTIGEEEFYRIVTAPQSKYGARISVRLPKSLHSQLLEISQREATSINQLVVIALAQLLGVFSDALSNADQEPNQNEKG